MSVYTLKRTQYIKAELPEVWAFFSNPDKLAEITPRYMNFKVTSEPHNGSIYPGQIITYTVSPILGIPLSWMTEITHVEPMRRFVDEQRQGPYRIWHHQHLFEEVEDGVLMTDIVHYQLPLSILGDLAHMLHIKRQVNSIFDYRESVIEQIFK